MNINTIKCTRCDTENPGNSKYCRSCGYELSKIVIENIPAVQPVSSKKRVSLGLTIGLFFVALFIGLLVGTMIGATGSLMYLNQVSKLPKVDKPVSQMVDRAPAMGNQNFPMMIDSETRLDSIANDNKTIQYIYTLVNMEAGKVDANAMKAKMKPFIINNIKTTPDLEYPRKQEMLFSFLYKDKNGNYLFSLDVTPNMYK
jgi:hypothetical protein